MNLSVYTQQVDVHISMYPFSLFVNHIKSAFLCKFPLTCNKL